MNIPGLMEGTPSESPAPDSRLTHWVSWDGGFCAWARPLDERRLLLVVCEDGEDWAQAQPGEKWSVVIFDIVSLDPSSECECEADELSGIITWLLTVTQED